MADTAPVTAASSIPQPGDGAYLARPNPQPGDGAYLAQRPNGGPSRGPRNNGRGRGRRPGNAGPGVASTSELPAPQIDRLTLDPSPNDGQRGTARGKGRSNGSRPNGASDAPHRGHNRPPRQRNESANGDATPSGSGLNTPLNPAASVFTPDEGRPSSPGSRGSQSRSRQRKPKTETDGAVAPKPVSSRRAAFERGAKLTTGDAAPKKKAARKPDEHREPLGPEPDGLNARLTRGLRGKPFIECPICFNPIFSQQQTWSCLPPHSPPEYPKTLEENERPAFSTAHYAACYTPFHINCIRDWASRSLHDDAERIRMSESKDEPSWRCPGCQKHRHPKIGGYSCGIHTCPKPDHKGACGRCLQASYDELICNCGHTVVYPPVACGTKVNCVFPCARPDPPCGHPKTPHTCHEEPDCPPCPFLTAKPCACGKDLAVKNIRCSQSQDRVSCGQVCGKLLGCGYHRCEKTCHPGDCESCTQTCNKPKRICKHACTHTCHAPAKCPENEACPTIVIQTCSCGNLQTRTTCGASTSNPSTREAIQLKCNADCMMRQRNARLADALGIKQPVDRTLTEWPPELRSFASANLAFVKTVENSFRDFINGTRQTVILPHMPPAKRTFVMSMADVYRLGRELIDAEPNRSVQIRRRVDTRLPNPLLSTAVQPPPSKLGGLGNLRSPPAGVWGASRSGAATPSTAASAAKANTPTASGPSSRVASPGIEHSRPTPPEAPRAHVPVTHAPVPVQTVGVVGDTDWDHSGDEAD
ncbi:hypothetical protein CspeluHIS016_0101100 [Cutaneotrichosporon spelunceum]|uniref:C2H2-type domain-containing protein n=1 Tax=Cutaneotrichosporon spelunceum TaxID=1672016 RepID=A0AAD3TN40_9TREE|nr:hypothetical protein CspeluHIS016_0101100 [Cutaneotrichosporon spelunceum]